MSDAVPEPRRSWTQPVFTALLLGIIVVLLGVIFLDWLERFVVFRTFAYVLTKVVDATGVSAYLVKGLLVVVLVPFFLALRRIGRIPLARPGGVMSARLAGAVVIVYVSGFFLLMHVATREQYFHHLGDEVTAVKYYALTPEGVRFFDSPGVDPKYGIALKPVTPELMANLERTKRGMVPKPLIVRSLSEISFFDPMTGEALVWYHRSASDEIELFSTGGFHPAYGIPLKPVTPELVAEIEHAAKRREEVLQRQAEDTRRAGAAAELARGRAEQQAAQRVAEVKRQAAIEKLVNTTVVNRPGPIETALVVLPEGQEGGARVEEALASALRERGVLGVSALFRPSFFREGHADALFAGDLSVASRVELGKRVDAVILGRSKVSFVQSEQFAGLITATLQLELRCLQVVAGRACGPKSITARGAGYDRSAALETAIANTRAEIDAYVRELPLAGS